MGTPSNFYKNPSISYKKDLSLSSVLQNLHAYNVATGNARPTEDQPDRDRRISSENRQSRESQRLENNNNNNNNKKKKKKKKKKKELEREDNEGPMSHEDYVNKRRKEASSGRPLETLTADVLMDSSSALVLKLVNYGSDKGTSSESDEEDKPTNSGHTDRVDLVRTREEQRFPVPGEPVCIICGKYGEYICDETDDDICSLECKADLLQSLKLAELPSSLQKSDLSSSELTSALPPIPKFEEDRWDYNYNRWSKKRSNLCTYECWKCHRPGHLAEDCLVTASNQVVGGSNRSNSVSRDLLALYKRCQQIGRNLSGANCNACRSSLSLATCLECSSVFCDNAGHLNEHISAHPSHQQFYSHKLRRLVKCCKSTCEVTDIRGLLACHYCLNKAFDKFYDMYTATWKLAGLPIIWGSICCEDHFEWHRMNCLSADVEDRAYVVQKTAKNSEQVQLNDFIF